MNYISELQVSLTKHLKWNKAHLTCFVYMLVGLIAAETVTLQKIALCFSDKAKISSRYRRIERFFANLEIDFLQIARWIFKLFFAHRDKYYLIIDRTKVRRWSP